MAVTVETSEERCIAAPPDLVWHVVSVPEMNEKIDHRARLIATRGSGLGSEFVIRLRVGVVHATLTYKMREWTPESVWRAEVYRGTHRVAAQLAELRPLPGGPGTLLRWTVSVTSPRLWRGLTARRCQRELHAWLAAVEREALALHRASS